VISQRMMIGKGTPTAIDIPLARCSLLNLAVTTHKSIKTLRFGNRTGLLFPHRLCPKWGHEQRRRLDRWPRYRRRYLRWQRSAGRPGRGPYWLKFLWNGWMIISSTRGTRSYGWHGMHRRGSYTPYVRMVARFCTRSTFMSLGLYPVPLLV
jgi:hypothetical protein